MLRHLTATRAITRGLLARAYTTEASGALLGRLKDDRKSFMRSKQQPDLNVVKNILSDYTYHIKSPNTPENQSEEAALLSVIQKLVKKRQDAIGQYTAGNRPELAEQEQGELKVLQRYLPEQMSAEEVEQKVKELIEQVGATSMKDMGKVMKAWTDQTADKKMVSDAVKKLLGQ
ncbi:Yqey-like protein-domain-containing protein [Zychaea mexicana]|uniref:Yqey-like protein-domain-containing protein n=1 Tax=Zychaea mexicana TaxID=64656 RepID=UPI0022FE2227|nr:Yqey-like protein-domain-containing protein [Zychaea mexicana]KAI9499375.1 Yqey-like protein-domain-containing protein [Zychaea mexicana]